MEKMILSISLICLINLNNYATKYSPIDEDFEKYSPNKKYVAKYKNESKSIIVSGGDNKDSILYQFDIDLKFDKIYLSNDGNSLAIVSWKYVQIDETKSNEDTTVYIGVSAVNNSKTAVKIYKRDRLAKEYSYYELCRKPSIPQKENNAPIGGFWRVWYKSITFDGLLLTLEIDEAKKISISLCNGIIVEVKNK